MNERPVPMPLSGRFFIEKCIVNPPENALIRRFPKDRPLKMGLSAGHRSSMKIRIYPMLALAAVNHGR